VQIVNARDQQPLGGVLVTLYDDVNRNRELGSETTNNAQGRANFFTSARDIYLKATKDGFNDLEWDVNRLTMCGDPTNCGTQRAMSPKLTGGEVGEECHFKADPSKPEIGFRAVLVWLAQPLDLDIWVRNYDCWRAVANQYACTSWSTKDQGCQRTQFVSTSKRDEHFNSCAISKPLLKLPSGAISNELQGGISQMDGNGRPIDNAAFANQFAKWVTWVSRHAKKMNRLTPGASSTWTDDNHILLDVDQRSGYGPETVTFINVPPGTYQIVVDKYTSGAPSLKDGQPTVQLYLGSNGVSFECKIDPACPHSNGVWQVAQIYIRDAGLWPGETKNRKYIIRIFDHISEGMHPVRRVELPTTESKYSRSCGTFCSESYFRTASASEYDDGFLADICYGTCKRTRGTQPVYDICLRSWEGPFHLASAGHTVCEGVDESANQDQCEEAVKKLAKKQGKTPKRAFQVCADLASCSAATWASLPKGCSAQTKNDDWTAYYKADGADGTNNAYQKVCPGTGPVLASYWDVGSCGPLGNDWKWDWCSQSTFNCKGYVSQADGVSTATCPSGKAKLMFIKGDGKTHGSYKANGCDYIYYAQYECEEYA
jgi:hypothetical protein